MPRYLIVADQTVTSPDLVARASQLARAESDSTFSLLLPALLPARSRRSGCSVPRASRSPARPSETLRHCSPSRTS